MKVAPSTFFQRDKIDVGKESKDLAVLQKPDKLKVFVTESTRERGVSQNIVDLAIATWRIT